MLRIDYVYDYMSRRCGVYSYGLLAGGEEESLIEGEAKVQDVDSASTTSLEGSEPGTTPGGSWGPPNSYPAANGGTWNLVSTQKFVWDGWNLSMELVAEREELVWQPRKLA